MRPNLSSTEIQHLLFKHWEIKGDISFVGGYDDQNIKVSTTNKSFILKISSSEEELSFFQAQNKILKVLTKNHKNYQFPMPIKDKDGNDIVEIKSNNCIYFSRLLTWIEGKLWNDIAKPSNNLYHKLGEFTGSINKSLIDIHDNSFNRKIVWDLKNYQDLKPYISLIKDNQVSNIINYFFNEYTSLINQAESKLRKSLIHNDINNYNIIVNEAEDLIIGVIDFGDMVKSSLINELAIVIAYSLIKSDNIQESSNIIIKAYSDKISLRNEELEILYYTVGIRLSMSIILSAYNRNKFNSTKALFVSEQDSIKSIIKWYSIDSKFYT